MMAMYSRCLATSGDALAMCPKLLVASASPDVASWCERGLRLLFDTGWGEPVQADRLVSYPLVSII